MPSKIHKVVRYTVKKNGHTTIHKQRQQHKKEHVKEHHVKDIEAV